MQTIIYPGRFDPITHGHTDLIARAASLFKRVIVAVADNPRKTCWLPHAERIRLVQRVVTQLNQTHVVVESLTGLLAHFAQSRGSRLILRGLRAASDLAYECQMASANRRLTPTLETVFLMPTEAQAFTAATVVREIAKLGGDVRSFVAPVVSDALQAWYTQS